MRRVNVRPVTLIAALAVPLIVGEARAAKLGYLRADCLSERMSAHDVISACTAEIQKSHKNPRAFIRRGAAFLEISAFDYAVGDFTRAITIDPNNAQAYQLRALAREMLGQLQESLGDYTRGLALNPSDGDSMRAILRVNDAVAARSLDEQRADAQSARQERDPVSSGVNPQEIVPSAEPVLAGNGDALFLLAIPALLLARRTATSRRLRRRRFAALP